MGLSNGILRLTGPYPIYTEKTKMLYVNIHIMAQIGMIKLFGCIHPVFGLVLHGGFQRFLRHHDTQYLLFRFHLRRL